MFSQLDFKVKKVVVIVVGVSLMGLGSWGARTLFLQKEEIVFQDRFHTVQTDEESALAEKEILIAVHVGGEVRLPGVYKLSAESRVDDAISMAEPLDTAYLDGLNLAMKLVDGQKIFVPSTSLENQDSRININTASQAELMTLPGIGEVTSQKIIRYRESKGLFYALEDLLKIDGFGEGKLADIESLVRLY